MRAGDRLATLTPEGHRSEDRVRRNKPHHGQATLSGGQAQALPPLRQKMNRNALGPHELTSSSRHSLEGSRSRKSPREVIPLVKLIYGV